MTPAFLAPGHRISCTKYRLRPAADVEWTTEAAAIRSVHGTSGSEQNRRSNRAAPGDRRHYAGLRLVEGLRRNAASGM
jgi:hypothetical protein